MQSREWTHVHRRPRWLSRLLNIFQDALFLANRLAVTPATGIGNPAYLAYGASTPYCACHMHCCTVPIRDSRWLGGKELPPNLARRLQTMCV